MRLAVESALAGEREHEIEHRILRPDGEVRWLYCRGEVLGGDRGEIRGMHGVAMDVTDRRAAEAERDQLLAVEQSARDRLAFLAEASAMLSRSLHVGAAMRELADLAVPRLGDWCVVDVLERGELRLEAVSHRDPVKVERVRRWRAENPTPLVHGPDTVVRTGSSQLLTDIDDATLRHVARDEAHLELLREVGVRSAVVVPLVARGTVLGTLTLLHDDESDRRHSRDHLALAEDLANRAGTALDNARLFQERAEVATVLQRALLPPELPRVPGVELAARHQPASEVVIGGDFYDAFENGDGSWTLLIGDVCGKDTAAATLTALARHSARAAVARDADPRAVLGVVNHAFRQQNSSEQFCTMVCARLRPGEHGAGVEIAVAGHPPPLVRRADGRVRSVEATGQLIGLFEAPARPVETVQLGAGDALLLYTDGITEARRGDELFGLERLVAAVSEHPADEAAALADGVLRAVAAFDNGDRRDDVALLALRIPRA